MLNKEVNEFFPLSIRFILT